MASCGNWLACDASDAVFELNRVDAIASKPAPTDESQPCARSSSFSRHGALAGNAKNESLSNDSRAG